MKRAKSFFSRVTKATFQKLRLLRDLFLGFAFYAPMRAEHKKKIVEAVK